MKPPRPTWPESHRGETTAQRVARHQVWRSRSVRRFGDRCRPVPRQPSRSVRRRLSVAVAVAAVEVARVRVVGRRCPRTCASTSRTTVRVRRQVGVGKARPREMAHVSRSPLTASTRHSKKADGPTPPGSRTPLVPPVSPTVTACPPPVLRPELGVWGDPAIHELECAVAAQC